jgi:type III pantothenate kinase
MKDILALDIGNSYIKCAVFTNGQIGEIWRYQTSDVQSAAQDFLDRSHAPVALSSVVPAATVAINQSCSDIDRPLYVVNPLSQKVLTGMHPDMGADRVAAAVAAWKIYGQGKLFTTFMTFGTATTLLTISENGQTGGGYIAPGVGMMFQSLHEKTALLPHLAMQGAEYELGHDTESHIQNGVLVGHIGLIREWLSVARKHATGDSVTVATGGWDETLEKHCKLFDFVDQDLTLKGVHLLASEALA